MKIHKSKNMDLTFLQRIERKESRWWGERLASFSLSLPHGGFSYIRAIS